MRHRRGGLIHTAATARRKDARHVAKRGAQRAAADRRVDQPLLLGVGQFDNGVGQPLNVAVADHSHDIGVRLRQNCQVLQDFRRTFRNQPDQRLARTLRDDAPECTLDARRARQTRRARAEYLAEDAQRSGGIQRAVDGARRTRRAHVHVSDRRIGTEATHLLLDGRSHAEHPACRQRGGAAKNRPARQSSGRACRKNSQHVGRRPTGKPKDVSRRIPYAVDLGRVADRWLQPPLLLRGQRLPIRKRAGGG